jgi:hypothetical protein
MCGLRDNRGSLVCKPSYQMKKSTKSEKPAAPQVKPVAKKSVEPVPAKKTVAPKKVPTPKKAVTSPAATAEAKGEALSEAPANSTPAAATTTIVAQIDVGFGNQLFVRGEGAGLSWDCGTLMSCVANDRWVLTLPDTNKSVLFKFVLNESNWSVGDDYVVAPGSTTVLTPSFT